MKLATFCLVAAAWIGYATEALAQGKQPTIVLNGGNGMGSEITRPVLEMAGGTRAVVAVVIHAQEPGDMALADWRRAEAAEVIPISASDVETSRRAFDRATLIWRFHDGDSRCSPQSASRLMSDAPQGSAPAT